MKYIPTDFQIPFYNFALEEMLLCDDKFHDSYILFYIHKPSIIIGKNQNAYEEINSAYVHENDICVARRLSGGGAVYHDSGNLNYSFITDRKGELRINFHEFTRPIISALGKFGIDASLNGRNDLCTGGLKFSGNAECIKGDRILHHGTIMFDVDINAMVNSLNVDDVKILSKSIKSIRSRVTNLKDYLPDGMTISDFRQAILEEYFKDNKISVYDLTKQDLENISNRAHEKFSKKSYVFGSKFKYNISRKKKFESGLIEAQIEVNKNTIENIRFYGDYFENRDISEIEKSLTGCAFDMNQVRENLTQTGFDTYIAGISTDDIIDLIFFT